jgi:hypothetical protein
VEDEVRRLHSRKDSDFLRRLPNSNRILRKDRETGRREWLGRGCRVRRRWGHRSRP